MGRVGDVVVGPWVEEVGRRLGPGEGRPLRIEAEVVEDPPGHRRLGDEGDEPQPATAVGAGEEVDGEKTGGPTTFGVTTIAVWKSKEAYERASEAVRAYYRRIGFDPPAMLARRSERAEARNFRALDEDQYDIPAFLRRGGHGVPE